MKKRMIAVLLTMAMCLTATACGKTESTNTSSASSSSSAESSTQESSIVPAGFPEKDITIILPYGSGSSQEAILRTACAYVEDTYDLSKSFVIVNKEGASGEIGLTAAYTSAHDGYTMAMFHSPHLTLDIVRGDECAFKYTDFAPVCNFMIDPTCWYVNGSTRTSILTSSP